MNRHSLFCAALLLALGTFAQAYAAPHVLVLPAETAKLKESRLPGYMIAVQKCATCHSADYIKYQPPGMTLSQWTAEMGKMQHVYGAPITDDDIKKVGAYLAVVYGSAKESDLPANLKLAASSTSATPSVAPSDTASTAVVASAKIDVNALLTSNNCLSCHALNQKIVGPAYHDVALKYKGDGEAISKVSSSIKNGGVGKWGQIPMPPFPQLTTDELHALAGYVLQQ